MSSFRSIYTVKRKNGGGYTDGIWQEATEHSFVISASLQPVSGPEMESLPEGRRESQVIKIYTSSKLQTVTDANPDVLEASGMRFEIVSVAPYQSNVLNHYKCIAVKIGEIVDYDEYDRITADGSPRILVDGENRIVIPPSNDIRLSADGDVRMLANGETRIIAMGE